MNFDIYSILAKPLFDQEITFEEALFVYKNVSTELIMSAAHALRMKTHKNNDVSWIIDRNVNITNICVSRCKFCMFSCSKGSPNAFVTSKDEYRKKIEELFALGGNQLLLQGGINNNFNLKYYCDLFSWLKSEFPSIKLHALSPAEIDFIAKKENLSVSSVLKTLIDSGLDSLPGAGAEILSDRVRKIISPAKIKSQQWLDVMHEAHKLGMVTSATMMFGHVETMEERIEHLFKIRDLQKIKPENAPGFLSFIPWPFYGNISLLSKELKNDGTFFPTPVEYIRLIAISRLVLNNIPNIQASWLTVGKQTAAVCLHSGANDLGSIMIEENVVSSAGAAYKMGSEEIKELIINSGFNPRQRNQDFTNFDNISI
ncbi:MAG: dehypoxanthine futalosine cyclase [Bacteroidales bacterium]|nr:dehypoxanthine futalosine cyclase [Bacteroidales bacterium]